IFTALLLQLAAGIGFAAWRRRGAAQRAAAVILNDPSQSGFQSAGRLEARDICARQAVPAGQ
ncbi:MAG: hypothetical protein ACKVP9_17070, partial [Burkholderiales bacterium]